MLDYESVRKGCERQTPADGRTGLQFEVDAGNRNFMVSESDFGWGRQLREHVEKLVDERFLEVCTVEMAYAWLRDRPLPDGFYRNRFSDREGNREAEERLLQRNEPLIDYALARYGRTADVAAKLYARLEKADRFVMRSCHFAGGGPEQPLLEQDLSDDLFQEITWWVSNPNLGDEQFVKLFQRKDVFERLSEKQWQEALMWAGRNDRLSTPYNSAYMDGWDEHSYRKPFQEAWTLASTVPVTRDWAGALDELLQSVVPSAHGLDVEATLERWRPDEDSKGDRWFDKPPTWFLRSKLAALLKPDEKMLNDNDSAVRASFYERFSPHQFPKWEKFAEREPETFFEFAVRNEKLWKAYEDRQKLGGIAWAVPDPGSHMDEPNKFRAFEQRMTKKYPEWFVEEDDVAAQERKKRWF